uniref:Global nitrogen transcriptional regulator n=1 Tax=Sarcopeltis skottsbergii TaxID=2765380 RepID=A0A7M1VI26_SARSK|nr:global nitrogen transcriptional regulator [Sarcopeltis skottsbergii]
MKWINYFIIYKIPFYIYKLNKGDSIIYINHKKQCTSIIVTYGILHLLKIFTNKEIITIGILSKENIIHSLAEQKNCYYQLIAIEESFLISFKWSDLIVSYNSYNNNYLFISIIDAYQNTLNKYEMMNQILIHKYTKNRIIQLILFLCKEFGFIQQDYVILPFQFSQITMSIITAGNRSTVNKVMNKLYRQNAISYSHNKYICLIDPFKLL